MTSTLRTILLASASPRRLELLESLGLEVLVQPSDYAEPADSQAEPLALARRHARAKALAVAARIAPTDARMIVAADTVVDLDGEALGKPGDHADAVRMLERLSGRTHVVHTAFALIVPGGEPVEDSSSTQVRFYPLDTDEIAAYVATGEPMDKAGAYGIQGRAAALVEAVDGDFYTVVGFPLGHFIRTLRRLGFRIPNAN